MRKELEDMPWIKLDTSATATRASNEHRVVIVVALIAAGTRMPASTQERLAMGKAFGFLVVLGLVLVLGTHPGVMAGLFRELFLILRGAGNELSAFITSL